jgi:DNA end-binding protein Ku
MQKLINQRTVRWSPDMVSDPIQENLLKLIAHKKKALRSTKKQAKGKGQAAAPSNAVNIMDALCKTVASEMKKKRKCSFLQRVVERRTELRGERVRRLFNARAL